MYILDVIVHYLGVENSTTSEEDIPHYGCNEEEKLRFLCLEWFVYVSKLYLEITSLHIPYGFNQYEDKEYLKLRFLVCHQESLISSVNVSPLRLHENYDMLYSQYKCDIMETNKYLHT